MVEQFLAGGPPTGTGPGPVHIPIAGRWSTVCPGRQDKDAPLKGRTDGGSGGTPAPAGPADRSSPIPPIPRQRPDARLALLALLAGQPQADGSAGGQLVGGGRSFAFFPAHAPERLAALLLVHEAAAGGVAPGVVVGQRIDQLRAFGHRSAPRTVSGRGFLAMMDSFRWFRCRGDG